MTRRPRRCEAGRPWRDSHSRRHLVRIGQDWGSAYGLRLRRRGILWDELVQVHQGHRRVPQLHSQRLGASGYRHGQIESMVELVFWN